MIADAELVARSRQRDAAAFGELVERHQRMVMGVALARCGDPMLAEDIAQEAFFAAWRDLDRLRDGQRVGPWVAGIARNLAANAVRTQARRGVPATEPARAPTPEDTAVEREDRELLARALADVPEAHREVLMRYYLAGESVAAIAAALGIREDLVKQRLSRGRRVLRDVVLARIDSVLERARPQRLGGRIFVLMTAKKLALVGIAVVVALGGTTAWYRHGRSTPATPVAAAKPAASDPARAGTQSLHIRRLPDPTARGAMLEAIRQRRAERASAAGGAPKAATPSSGAASGPAPALPSSGDDVQYILDAIQELTPILKECYEQGLERDPALRGNIVVRFTVEGEPAIGGVVGESTVVDDESTIRDPSVRECIQQTMYALQMDPPSSGRVEARTVMSFVPDDAEDEGASP